MAQAKPEMSKSQIIRDFVIKNPDLSIPEVVTMLGERGVHVSKNHVYVVKGKMKAKKRKESREKAVAEASSIGTAKANGSAPSKSSAIRALLKVNRKMPAKEVVAALAEKGVSVTEGLVYFVKGQLKGRRGSTTKAAKAVPQTAKSAASANGDAVSTILKVKGWAAEVGGLKKLKALVEALID